MILDLRLEIFINDGCLYNFVCLNNFKHAINVKSILFLINGDICWWKKKANWIGEFFFFFFHWYTIKYAKASIKLEWVKILQNEIIRSTSHF